MCNYGGSVTSVLVSMLLLSTRGRSRTAATSKMECFMIIVNGLEAVSYYHKALHLGCCSSPRSASEYYNVAIQHLRDCGCVMLK